MKKSILVVALSEYQDRTKNDLLKFASDYTDSSDSNACWHCICDCVDLWREAQVALDELSSRGDIV